MLSSPSTSRLGGHAVDAMLKSSSVNNACFRCGSEAVFPNTWYIKNRTSSYFTTPDFPVLGSILPAKPCQAMSAWRHVEGFMPVVARYAELLSVPCKGPCSVQFGVQVTRSQPRARKHLLSGGTAQKRPGLHDSSGHEMKEEVSTQQSQRSSS